MLACARMLPTNDVLVPSVAELPTTQKTLHGDAPPVSATFEPVAVVSVLTALKTKTPGLLSVTVPVNKTDES